ncbi:MAG: hypothetical protein KDA29_12620 [Phycisphaerales bacterium]|nr:hypothetical protein [Phycisphaerales bacterium]
MRSSMVFVGAFALAQGAGLACGAGAETPVTLSPSVGQVQHRAHIYFNVATGERVVTQLGDGETQGADTGNSEPIWATLVQNACASEGYTTEFFFGFDNPGPSSLSTNITVLDYGDIALDSVVDCFQVNWVVAHPDTDTDLDSVGDGVEELAGQWVLWEPDNGRAANNCSRLPLVNVLFFNLPGNIAASGFLSGYTLDVDLVAGFTGTDLSFEIGDSDGDCQTAAFCNNDVDTNSDGIGDGVSVANADRDFDSLPDSDIDGDGLFDWSWTVRFYQPGIGNDFDSDGDTGVAPPSSSDTIGISFGFPEGSAIDNGDGTWAWNIDSSADPAGTGEEDRFAIYTTLDDGGGNELIIYNGGYWFGGFACTGGLISTGGAGYSPPAMFQFVLYGPNPYICCPSDYNCDGAVNFFDVSAFLADWQNGEDYNGDGQTNFFDVSAFLTDFNAGCP